MAPKTPAEIEKVVLAAVDLEYIEEALVNDEQSQVEVTITSHQDIFIRRNNPLQEFIVEVNVR